MIIVNRKKAEATTRERLRAEREPLLADLDLQYMRALEEGADTSKIVEQKQKLRDVTDKDLSALSIEALAALTLEEALNL